MSRFSTTSRFTFEPVAEAVPLDALAVAYQTPAALHERLYNLALVGSLRATARFYMTHNSTSGVAKVRLTDGITAALDIDVSLASSPVSINQPVDLSRYDGASALFWEVEITTAGTAASVGKIAADLTVETPLFVSIGQC